MILYLLDTSSAVRSLRGDRQTITTLNQIAADKIAVSLITRGELYAGAYWTSDPARHLAACRQLLRNFTTLGLNDAIMEHFGEIRAYLGRRNLLISELDILIGATAAQHQLTVITHNVQHFQRIPGISIFRP
jgi:predicted nucleic acid-binding protein